MALICTGNWNREMAVGRNNETKVPQARTPGRQWGCGSLCTGWSDFEWHCPSAGKAGFETDLLCKWFPALSCLLFKICFRCQCLLFIQIRAPDKTFLILQFIFYLYCCFTVEQSFPNAPDGKSCLGSLLSTCFPQTLPNPIKPQGATWEWAFKNSSPGDS